MYFFLHRWRIGSMSNNSSSCTDTGHSSMGFLGTRAFLCPPLFVLRKWTSFSHHDLPQVPRDRFRQVLIREGWNSQAIIVQSWGRILVPSQGIHIIIQVSYTPKRKDIFLMILFEEYTYFTTEQLNCIPNTITRKLQIMHPGHNCL